MSPDPNIFIAFFAGLLSFLSPCVLPLIPSYLSFIGGVSFGDLEEGTADRSVVFRRTLAFVAGFTVVFVLLGVIFSSSGFLFSRLGTWINIGAGGIIVLLGINIIFDFISVLNLEKRMHLENRPSSYFGAAVVGMAFGAGWSPCIGPILAGILFLAGSSGQVLKGIILLFVYSFGLGLPFLAASLAFGAVNRRLNRLKRHFGTIKVVSGLFLVLIGFLIAFGRFQLINGLLARWGTQLESWSSTEPVTGALIVSLILLVTALFGPMIRVFRKRQVIRPVGITLSAILIALAILNYLNVLDIVALLARWFTYQGI